MTDSKPTPLYHQHVALGGRMVDFAGYQMPMSYEGIVAEHHRVRQHVGLFDVSHMGEVRVTGPDAVSAVNGLVSNDVSRLKDGRAQYNIMCAPDGTIVDDLIVYRLSETELFICVNAANQDTDFAHMVAHAKGDATFTNESAQWAQIAVQGPAAPELLGRLLPEVFPGLRPFRIVPFDAGGSQAYAATTGYTGELGAELYVPSAQGAAIWERLMTLGADLNVGAVGLGARNTLRLEMAYCLYGQDIDRSTTPLEAGLGWVTKLDRQPFVGRDALLAQHAAGVPRKLVGVEVFDRGIPRHGYPVLSGEEVVGTITSGTRSPSTGRSIGLAYVPTDLSHAGTELCVDCRGRHKAARVVDTPFYKRAE